MSDKELNKKLRGDPRFIPFNKAFDYEFLRSYIKKNKDRIVNRNLIEKALSTFLFNSYYLELKDHSNNFFANSTLSKNALEELFVCLINREYYLVTRRVNEALDKRDQIHFDEITNFSIKSAIKEFDSFNAQGGLEALHDALNLILNQIHQWEDSFDDEKINALDIQKCIQLLTISNLHTITKNAYDTAIWENYNINYYSDKEELKIKSPNPKATLIERIGGYRLERNVGFSKATSLSKYSEKGEFYRLISKTLIAKRKPKRLKFVRIENKFVKFKLADGFDKDAIHIELMLFSELTSYYQFLGNEKLPHLDDLSIHDLVTVFSELQNLMQRTSELSKTESSNAVESIRSYELCIQRHYLIDYLLSKTKYTRNQIKMVVDIFSHVDGYHNLWEKPILRRNNFLIPVLLPIISPNGLRIIDYWLEAGGFDLDSRGKLFEQFIKKTLLYEISRKGFWVNSPDHNIYRNTKNEQEEIDLIIELKNIIIISEIKCIKFPFDPRDYHNMYNRLEKGANQIKRKSAFLKRNMSDFKDFFRDSTKEIIPLVITNYPLYSGLNISSIPICDFSLLENYFVSGSLNRKQIGISGRKTKSFTNSPSIIYYKNEDECSKYFKEFIANPIPVKELMSKAKITEKQISLPNATLKITMDYPVINDPIII